LVVFAFAFGCCSLPSLFLLVIHLLSDNDLAPQHDNKHSQRNHRSATGHDMELFTDQSDRRASIPNALIALANFAANERANTP
jgi:hypothetical protein